MRQVATMIEELAHLRHQHECSVHSMLILVTLSRGRHPHFMAEAQNQLLILSNWPQVTQKEGFVLKVCIEHLRVICVLERFTEISNYFRALIWMLESWRHGQLRFIED